MTDVLSQPLKRPKRAAAANALYRSCPSCDRKFLITEIEFHVNMCLQKMEREAAKLSPKETKTKPEQTDRFPADKKYESIPQAPVFRPTVEQFKDPLAYINSIRLQAEKHGICKIIPPTPPTEWLAKTIEETITPEDFLFQTKRQNVRWLARRGVSDEFYCKLTEFLNKSEKELKAIPKILGKRVQPYFLYKAVTVAGGYNFVTAQDLWGEIASQLNLPPLPPVVEQLKSIYEDNLLDFENSPDKFIVPTRKAIVSNSKSGMRAVKAAGMGMQCVKAPTMNAIHVDSDGDTGNSSDTETDTDTDNEQQAMDQEEEEESFGFATGRIYSLASFKKQARRFKRDWFRAPDRTPYEPSIAQIETEYWNIVENRTEHCRVHYGSDLDVKSHGSGFHVDSSNPWNLNILPTLPKSLLRFLPEHVSGITIPMMYVGMLFSTFCWHVEDDYLFSINFLHTGAPKLWYGVSSYHCTQFEQAMKDALPDLFEVQPDLLHHLTTMLSPIELAEAGVPVVKSIQYPGEFMITFPQAYHGGFNTGFNVAEAVNFATPDWLPFGALVVRNYRLLKRTHIFSNIELIVNALQLERDPNSIKQLLDAFWEARQEEVTSRRKVINMGVQTRIWNIQGPLPHAKPCKVCNAECYLSAIGCACCPDLFGCLEHVEEFCSCPVQQKTLLSRYSIPLMDSVVANAEKYCGGHKRYLSPSRP
mmetsp:Transcript_25505/g.32484  ORF Transcript_25505/g.32484 Transcript_25505/m.32484 type:complete len:701 (-) Transcript_25505:1209-3311(-)